MDGESAPIRSEKPHRETARHALVSELLEGSFVKGSAEGEANFIESEAGRFARVCIIGTVVERKSTEDGPELIVADATAEILVRPANDLVASTLQGLNKGADALLIGKVRETRERFLLAEIARPLEDPNWEAAHLLSAALSRKKSK
jgi:RPA family protein